MNVHDSQRMEESLRAHGFEPAEDEHSADLIVFNTCSVREKAVQKLRSEVGRLRSLKRARPDLVVAVAGCVAEQEGKRLLREESLVDLVLGPDHLAELPLLVHEARLGAPPQVRTGFDVEAPVFLAFDAEGRGHRSPASAYVTTMKGCDERCSFCIVPYTRGPERYRPAEDIVREASALVDAGAREITLLGQTVNSWSSPLGSQAEGPSDFGTLLRFLVERVPSLGRLRYASPHPRHADDALLAAHRDLPVLAKHVHLPVQSGSDRVLRRMIRRYGRDEYLRRVDRLRSVRPEMTLSTDIIVGFPGETDEDFELTLDLVRQVGFVSLFGFKYSKRPNTPALRLLDEVPEEIKEARLASLFAVAESQQRRHLESLVGSRCTVLFEGASRPAASSLRAGEQQELAAAQPSRADAAPMRVMGRSERNEIVHVEIPKELDPQPLIGTFVEVTVSAANAHSLVGSLDRLHLDALPGRQERPTAARRSLSVLAPT